jgi:hypothetical protein
MKTADIVQDDRKWDPRSTAANYLAGNDLFVSEFSHIKEECQSLEAESQKLKAGIPIIYITAEPEATGL